jgi:hypothetical protein
MAGPRRRRTDVPNGCTNLRHSRASDKIYSGAYFAASQQKSQLNNLLELSEYGRSRRLARMTMINGCTNLRHQLDKKYGPTFIFEFILLQCNKSLN